MIELAPYSFPTLRNLRRYVTLRIEQFIKNAGTVILLASIIIWSLLNLPFGGQKLEESIFGRLSRGIAPLFTPAGFGNWESSGSLVTGLIAKEVVVSTMSQIYVGEEHGEVITGSNSFLQDLQQIGAGFVDATIEAGKELIEIFTPGISVFGVRDGTQDTALSLALTQVYSPLSALAFLVFVLLYLPCVATLGTIRGEFGWKWALFSAVYQTTIAWLLAVVVYQGGRMLGFA
jgi:ferrous iron transport protein B